LAYATVQLDFDKTTQSVQVAFCVRGAIIHKDITKQTQYFYTNRQRALRTQFPLQNSFSLTVHKTQGLTLPKVSLALDNQFFSADQAFVALSRYPSWDQSKYNLFTKMHLLQTQKYYNNMTNSVKSFTNNLTTHKIVTLIHPIICSLH